MVFVTIFRFSGLKRLIYFLLLLPCCLAGSSLAANSFSANLGLSNPPTANLHDGIGLNFLWHGSNWGFELGLSGVNGSLEDEDSDGDGEDETDASFHIFGGANLKYLFDGNLVRPYLQIGYGLGLSADSRRDSDKVDGGRNTGAYGGLGLFLMGSKVYAYGSFNVWLRNTESDFFQLGVGVYL